MVAFRGRIVILLVFAWLAGTSLLMTLGPYASLDTYRSQFAIPEETPGMTQEALAQFLSEIGSSGRAHYSQVQWFDFLAPILLGLAAFAVLGWASRRLSLGPTTRGILFLLPTLVVLTEVAENSLLLSAIARHPGPGMIAGAIGIITGAKLALFTLTIAAMLLSSIWVAIRSFRSAT